MSGARLLTSNEGDALLLNVVKAAKALVESATTNSLFDDEVTVSERALTDLESALADAGYDLTDEEFHERCAL